LSGTGLLFETAKEYERTHQLAIYTLLRRSDLAKYILGVDKEIKVNWEPQRQLFDLGIETDANSYFIEIKMWAGLSQDQHDRQNNFLQKNNYFGVYVFLGTTWFEYDKESFKNEFGILLPISDN
jgi:hypothetical protein